MKNTWFMGLLDLFGLASVIEVLFWSGRETEDLILIFFVVCITLILSGGWWHGISFLFSDIIRGKEEASRFVGVVNEGCCK